MREIQKSARRGASGLTYAVLVGLVAVVAIGAIANAGSSVNRLFGTVSSAIGGVTRQRQAVSFDFSDIANATTGQVVTTNSQRVTNVTAIQPVSVSGGGTPQIQVCADSACSSVIRGWTTATEVSNGQWVQARATAGTSATPVTATVTIGLSSDSFTVTSVGLYAAAASFNHTFTNCSATGRDGPDVINSCRPSYPSAWATNNAWFNQGSFNGYQLWTVPATGTYRITAAGARGGSGYSGYNGGNGNSVRAEFALTEGEQITIVVGQMGQDRSANRYHGGGGGGASWVCRGATATGCTLMLAGAGGGGYNAASDYNNNGDLGQGVNAYYGGSSDASRDWGSYRGNGASFSVNGMDQYSNSNYWAQSFQAGARGGLNTPCYSTFGGFGGGGTPHCHNGGGGAGYPGGAGGLNESRRGEGGGSYVSGSNQSNQGANSSHGFVIISRI